MIREELKDDPSDKLFYFKNNVTEKVNNQYIDLLAKYTIKTIVIVQTCSHISLTY